MARDETARDSTCEQSLLDRRSHCRLAGAAAATVAGAGAVSTDGSASEEVQDGSE